MFRNAVVIAGEEKMKDFLTKIKEAYRIASIISALVAGGRGFNLVLGYCITLSLVSMLKRINPLL